MQREHGFAVYTDGDLSVACIGCLARIADGKVAALTRTQPDTPMTAWCHDCFGRIVQLAKERMDEIEVLKEIFG